jgi:Tfp pilus assembly protein PilN
LITKPGLALYHVNLIRDQREREYRAERRHRLALILGIGCFGFFALSLIYSGLTIWQMEHVLTNEQDKVRHLQQEYQKYAAARLIVDKSDIELLSGLQSKGVFWTRKLAAMAKHLPDNYWITGIEYANGEVRVQGYGLLGPQQDQLGELEAYMNRLRTDTSFADVFPRVFLNLAQLQETSGRVGFDYSAVTKDWNSQ